MHPVHDADALLLLAITLASKRMAATLGDLVVSLARIQDRLPAEARLLEAFERLSRHGLIAADEGGYRLCEAGENVMRGVPGKKEFAEQLFMLKERLAQFDGKATKPAAQPRADELAAAIAAWRASRPPLNKSERFELRRQEQGGAPARPGLARARAGASRASRKPWSHR